MMLQRPEHLTKFARDALEESGDDYDVARKGLVNLAKTDKAVRDYLIEQGADYIIRQVRTKNRSPTTEGRASDKERLERSGREFASGYQCFLDTYTLFGGDGVKLRNATKAQLEESAQRRRVQADGTLKRARFEESLASKLGANDTVGQRFTDEQVFKMHERITHANA